MADNFVSGVWGRVYATGYGVIGGIKTWSIDATTAEVPIPHFESTVDAYGRVWPNYLTGLSGATGQLEGYFNVGTAGSPVSDRIFSNGFQGSLALYLDKRSSWGFGVLALITNFRPQVAVENQPVSFTATFRVNGVVPLSGVG